MIPISSAPGPEPGILFGGREKIMRYARNPVAYATKLFEKYGPVASVVRAPIRIVHPGKGWGIGKLAESPGAGVVVATGAEINREVLTAHERYHMCALPGRFYPTGNVSARRKPLERTMTGLFHVNEGEHRRHRRLLMPAFHKTRIDAYREDMVRIIEELCDRWTIGETRDVASDMQELTLRIATKTLFGEDVGDRGIALARKMQQWLLTMFTPGMVFPIDFPGLPFKRFLDLTHQIDKETWAILDAKRHRPPGGDMLSMLIAARDEDGSALDEDELVGHTGVIFAAGHETSTNALAWTLFLLSQHPKVARDLADELSILGGNPPSLEDLGKLPLLEAVVKESMRVLPPVPMHPRIVAEESELGGHHFPVGSEIFLSIFHMHHDPQIFRDPDAFDPRRWETVKPSTFEYNPFSAGPRMCIGASFAMMEIKIALAMMLQRFAFELPDQSQITPRIAITMAPKNGLRMTLRRKPEDVRTGRARGRIHDFVRLPS
jgi:cytochrome P450